MATTATTTNITIAITTTIIIATTVTTRSTYTARKCGTPHTTVISNTSHQFPPRTHNFVTNLALLRRRHLCFQLLRLQAVVVFGYLSSMPLLMISDLISSRIGIRTAGDVATMLGFPAVEGSVMPIEGIIGCKKGPFWAEQAAVTIGATGFHRRGWWLHVDGVLGHQVIVQVHGAVQSAQA